MFQRLFVESEHVTHFMRFDDKLTTILGIYVYLGMYDR